MQPCFGGVSAEFTSWIRTETVGNNKHLLLGNLFILYYTNIATGFSLGLNDRAQRPVVLFGALSFFLSTLSFFQRPVIFREPFGFFGLLSALFWASSRRKRPIKAKGGTIFMHHVIHTGHRHHLGFTSQISAWEWGYANGIWRNVIFAIVYLESGAGIYE